MKVKSNGRGGTKTPSKSCPKKPLRFCPTHKGEGGARFGNEVGHPTFHSLSLFCGYPLLIGLTRAEPAKSGRTIAPPPPKKRGFLVTPIAALCDTPLSLPQGVAIVLIDPCGKARKRPTAAALTRRREAP